MMNNADATLTVGTRVSVPQGYYPDGSSKPRKVGTVVHVDPEYYPRILWDNSNHIEYVTPTALTIIGHTELKEQQDPDDYPDPPFNYDGDY